jgi:NAD-dependent SIR2 family protein deacetylase
MEKRADGTRAGAARAAEIMAAGGVLVLSGAGLSTDSGIPDYRGPLSSRRKSRPTRHSEFLRSPDARRRYWSRSTIGWPMVRDARPNDGHRAVAQLERRGLVRAVLTQNVDGLHLAAGSQEVLELHGSLYDVRCLACGEYESRDALQHRLLELNPGWPGLSGEMAPDGDVELPPGAEESFRVAACSRCGGPLKPEVVFFGDSVPEPRVARAWSMLERASSLLVLGSSLHVFSGYRFVRGAAERGMPILIINDGETRGDRHAQVKLAGRIDAHLPVLLRHLGVPVAFQP